MNARQRRKWRRKFYCDRDAFLKRFKDSVWESPQIFLPKEISYKNTAKLNSLKNP